LAESLKGGKGHLWARGFQQNKESALFKRLEITSAEGLKKKWRGLTSYHKEYEMKKRNSK
jgi:hypothetical protein